MSLMIAFYHIAIPAIIGFGTWAIGFAILSYCRSVENRDKPEPAKSTDEFYTEEQKFKLMNAFLEETAKATVAAINLRIDLHPWKGLITDTRVEFQKKFPKEKYNYPFETYTFDLIFVFKQDNKDLDIPLFIRIWFDGQSMHYQIEGERERQFNGELWGCPSEVIARYVEKINDLEAEAKVLKWCSNVLNEKE